MVPTAVTVALRQEGGSWVLDLSADRFAQSVAIEAEGFLPADNWFHLAPGGVKAVRLAPRPGADPATRPRGEVRGPGVEGVISF